MHTHMEYTGGPTGRNANVVTGVWSHGSDRGCKRVTVYGPDLPPEIRGIYKVWMVSSAPLTVMHHDRSTHEQRGLQEPGPQQGSF